MAITVSDLSGSSFTEHIKAVEIVQRSVRPEGGGGRKKDGRTPRFAGKILSYLEALAHRRSNIGPTKTMFLGTDQTRHTVVARPITTSTVLNTTAFLKK